MDYQEVYDPETVEKLRKEFSRLKGVSYLDHTGTTLYPEGLVEAVSADLCSRLYGNPHALNSSSRLSSEVVEQTRERVLSLFNTDSSKYHLVFTSGATGALQTLAHTFSWGPDHAFAYFAESHTSILGMRQVAENGGSQIIPLTVAEMEEFVGNKFPTKAAGGLFAFPGQCNFSGAKYPLSWIELIRQRGNWKILLDAASLAASSPLDLSTYSPDFVCLSFYKMFGLPTGLGALLIRSGAESCLRKQYFGGGTVLMALASGKLRHERRPTLHEWFEDGTDNFLAIGQLRIAIEYFTKLIPGLMHSIEDHTFNLAKYLFQSLSSFRHYNGKPLAVLYNDGNFESKKIQGPIVNFNLKRADDTFIGFSEVLHICNLFDIHIRTGCFCNTGACQRHLGLTVQELEQHFEAGHVCGDAIDLLGGRPTGSVRASVGYCSTKEDVDKILNLLKKTFLELTPKIINSKPLKELQADSEINDGLKLSRLFVYPVKSCGPQEVQSWPLDHRGLVGDRCWMVATDALTPLSQKHCPRLCLIRPFLDLETHTLTLSFPGAPDITVLPRKDSPSTNQEDDLSKLSKVCGARVQILDCGDEVADWISLALEVSGLRLFQQWESDQRQQKKGFANLSLSNEAQFLLIGLSSLAWLENQVKEKLETEEDSPPCDGENLLQRFRTNMIVKGSPAFDEKQWKAIRIGNVSLKNDGPCVRCQIVCIDQSSGEKTVEPLRTIAATGKGKIEFGSYFSQLSDREDKFLFVGSPVLPIDL